MGALAADAGLVCDVGGYEQEAYGELCGLWWLTPDRCLSPPSLLDCIVLDAVGDRYRPVYAEMRYRCENAGRIYFHDDAMREELGGAWDEENEGFCCTGSKTNRNPLTLRGTGGARARVAVSPPWEDYRVSVSVLPGDGRGGPWVTLNGGDRLFLLLDGADKTIRLERRGADNHAVSLANRPAPAYEGWRKLSLFCRDGMAYGFLDTEPVIRVALDGAPRTAGAAGLCVERGEVFFDDVTARGVEELVPGTDRAPMEEGSCFARPDIAETTIELRNIYSRQWYLRPSCRTNDATVRVALPNYVPAAFRVDGAAAVPVSPSPAGAALTLDPAHLPRRDVAFVCSGWRDYVFTTRVTDWYWTGAPWTCRSRWSCDPVWEWLDTNTRSGKAGGISTLWYKARLSPPYTVNALMAVGDAGTLGDDERNGRDLNLVVGGNGKDFSGAYAFRVMGAGKRGCELWRDGERLAAAPELGIPHGHPVHHVWFEIRVVVEPRSLRFFFEDREAFVHRCAEPIPAGRIGLWTENNAVLVARATISAADRSSAGP